MGGQMSSGTCPLLRKGDRMKKGQVLEGTIEKVVFPNKGIVSVEGETEKAIACRDSRFALPSTRPERKNMRAGY